MENATGNYKAIIKKWIVDLVASLKALPKRSDVPANRPHPPEEANVRNL